MLNEQQLSKSSKLINGHDQVNTFECLPTETARKVHLQTRLGQDFDPQKIERVLACFAQFDEEMFTLAEKIDFGDCNSPPNAEESAEWTLITTTLWTSVNGILGAADFKKAYDTSLEEAIEIAKFWASGDKG